MSRKIASILQFGQAETPIYLPTQNLYGLLAAALAIGAIKGTAQAYFSNTTPSTSSTSPASPLPVMRARQSAA